MSRPTRSQILRRLGSLGASVLLASPLLIGGLAAQEVTDEPFDEASSEATLLNLNAIVERVAAAEQVDLFVLFAEPGRRYALWAEQLGVDVRLDASWSKANASDQEMGTVDAPLDFDGLEVLLIPPSANGEIQISVRAILPPGVARARYRLRLEDWAERTANLPRQQALATLTAAGRHYGEENASGRRQSLDFYRRAVSLLDDLGEHSLAAQAQYSMAVLHRLLGESELATEASLIALEGWRKLGDVLRQVDTLNELGLLETQAGRFEAARGYLTSALELLGGERSHRQAFLANNLCLSHLYQGNFVAGADCYYQALEAIRATGDVATEAVALTNLGTVHRILGQPDASLESFSRALELHRRSGRTQDEARALHQLAVYYVSFDEIDRGLGLFLEALTLFEQLGDRTWTARVLHNLGSSYLRAGDGERAAVFAARALELRRELKEPVAISSTLSLVGELDRDAGQLAVAIERFTEALELMRQGEDRVGEANGLIALGNVAVAERRYEHAVELGEQAVALGREVQHLPLLTRALWKLGEARLGAGQLTAAASDLEAASDLARATGQRDQLALILLAQASLERQRGEHRKALEPLDKALAIWRQLRGARGDPDQLASFAGARRRAHEMKVDLFWQLGERQVEPRFEWASALEASEQGRSWGFVEWLRLADEGSSAGSRAAGEAAPTPDGAVDVVVSSAHEASSAWRLARRRLFLLMKERHQLLASGTIAEASEPDPRLTSLETRLLTALAEIEQAERRWSMPVELETEPRTAAELQGSLGEETVALEYALGESRSFVFVMTRNRLAMVPLPPRAEIEALAHDAHRQLAEPGTANSAMAELGRLILAPALEPLEAWSEVPRRLAIVADGALHYLPFAVLPWASSKGEMKPLISEFEVVSLPSLRGLLEIRRRGQGRLPSMKWAAVLADPVFDASDLRLAGLEGTVGSGQAPEIWRSTGLVEEPLLRLFHSRKVAEYIRPGGGSAATGSSLVALDTEASRSLAMSGELADYRIVHFATHGVIDDRYPPLSGLALSSVDRDGKAVDGLLRLPDIYRLNLQAELVILSACRSAIGRHTEGEGLVGLNRGFFAAGADRVIATLWSVSDHGSAELMARFYRFLGREPSSAAAALRQAQLSMLSEPRWRDPFYWAAFTVTGDW